MQKFITHALLLLLAIWAPLAGAQTPAQFTGLLTDAVNYSGTTNWNSWYTANATSGAPGTYSGPAYGGSLTDPIFNVTYKQAPAPTDCPSYGGNPSGNCATEHYGYVNGYSKTVQWSADGHFYLIGDVHGWFYLYDATTTPYTFIRRIQLNASGVQSTNGTDFAGGDESNWEWSRTPGTHLLYYNGYTTGSTDRVALKVYNPDTNTASVVHDFSPTIALYSGCVRINNEREGEQSDDDKMWAFTCNTASGDNGQNAFIIYNKTTDAVVSKSFAQFCSYVSGGSCLASSNYVTMSPLGDYYVVDWNPTNCGHDSCWTPGNGTELFDVNLNFLGGVTSQDAHGDVGMDVSGNEIFAQYADAYADFNDEIHELGVCKLSLVTNNGHVGTTASGGCEHYAHLPSTSGGSGTISLRATQGSGRGYAALGYYESGTSYLETQMFSLEMIALRLDFNALTTTSTVSGPLTPYVRLGRTHSLHADNGDYEAQPDVVPNNNFTKYSFTSTKDIDTTTEASGAYPAGSGHYSVFYVELPAQGSAPATPSSKVHLNMLLR